MHLYSIYYRSKQIRTRIKIFLIFQYHIENSKYIFNKLFEQLTKNKQESNIEKYKINKWLQDVYENN